MTAELSLIVPCFNEGDNVIELATRFFTAASLNDINVEIVFVDDCSIDQTLLMIHQMKAMYPLQVNAISNHSNVGIAESWSIGLDGAEGNLVCFIDGDLQNPPEEVFKLLHTMKMSNCELVRGVRCPHPRTNDLRFLMSRILNWLLNRYFGMTSGDNKSGFILTSRELARAILRDYLQFQYYQTFIGVATKALGVRTVEIQTPFQPRRSGVSFLDGTSISVALKVLCEFPLAKRHFKSRKLQSGS